MIIHDITRLIVLLILKQQSIHGVKKKCGGTGARDILSAGEKSWIPVPLHRVKGAGEDEIA